MGQGGVGRWWLIVLFGLLGLVSLPVSAQQGFEVLIDTNSRLTGCDVTTPDGVFEGAEYIATVITSADGSQITALSIRSCNPFDDTFGAPQALPGPPLPIGQGLGTGGSSVLEFAVDAARLGNPVAVRLGLISLDGGSPQDALLTRDGQPDGGAMLVVLIPPPPAPPTSIPTLTPWSLALLVVLLGAAVWLGRRRLRHHPLMLSLLISGLLIGVVWAIDPDGDPADWAGIDPLGTDPAGDGIPDIRALFGTRSNGDLVLRIDAVLNQPPQAQDDAFTTDEDTVLNGDVLADNGNGADSDPDSDPLTVTAVNGATGDVGTEITLGSGALLTVNADGSFVYDPNGAFDGLQVGDDPGEDGFTYTISDGRGGTDTVTVTITIMPVNTPPSPQDDDFTVTEGGTLNDNVRTNDSDPDNVLADLAVNTTPVSGPSHATAFTLNGDGSFSYIHDGSETTSDGFDYEICDPEPLCDTATVTITVTSVNDAPVLDFPTAGTVNYDPFTDLPVILDPAATVTDVDSADFDGGVLTANITTNCNDADRIDVNDQGVGTDQISVSGTDVGFGDPAVLIGTIATEFDCTTADPLLAITLTADATLPAVQALLRNLNFSTSDDTSTDPRTVEVTVSDGDGGISNTVNREVTLDEAPRLTSTSPADGVDSVTLGSTVTLTFSETVAFSGTGTTTVDCGGNVPFTVSGSPGTVITLDPDSDLSSGANCTVSVAAADVTDTDAIDPPDNPVQNESFGFITVDQPPVVETVVPADGADPVASDTDITLTFSEDVTVTGNWAQVDCDSSGIQDVNSGLAVTDNNPTFTLDPATDFAAGETCTVTVFAAQVNDTDGIPPDAMASNFTSIFTIDQAPGLTLVEAEVADVFNTVNGTFPGNGLINTDADTGIRLTFSEAVSITNDGVQVNCTVSGLQSTTAGTLTDNGTTMVTWTPGSTFTPGETCTVMFDTTDVNDTDTVDPPDNLTATGSFQFEVRPAAVDDARTVTAHIQASFTGANMLLANDTPASDAALTIAFGETLGSVGDNAEGDNATFTDDARVQISSDGSLLYNPPPGAGGGATDMFFYRLTATHGSTDTAQVTVTINGPVVWFIDDDAGTGGNGTLLLPFNELVSADSFDDVAADDPGDYIFMYDSIGDDAAFNCGLTLLANQRLLGEGETQTLGTLTGLSPVSESTLSLPATTNVDPVLTASNTNCINLASGNTLRGFTVGNTGTGTGIDGSSAGTLVVRETSITGSGVGIHINGGTLDASFDAISSSNNAGILLNNVSGDFDVATGTITAGSNTAVRIVGNPSVDLGVTLTRVSANGAANGIVLTNTTGNSGGFTVTGNGGSCTAATPTCTGGRIQSTVGADGAVAGSGVYLNNTGPVSLSFMRIDNHPNYAIFGDTVQGFSLIDSLVDGANGNNDALDEGSIRFEDLLGSSAITRSDISGGHEDNLRLVNETGTLDRLVITDSSFHDNSDDFGNDGILLESRNAAVMNITVTGTDFSAHRGDHFDANATDTSTLDVIFTDNMMSGDHPNVLGQTFILSNGASAGVTFDVSDNSIEDAVLSAFTFFQSAATTTSSSLIGTFSGNTVGVTGENGSGSAQGHDAVINATGSGTVTMLVDNNEIRQWSNQHGILVQAGDESPTVNVTVSNNILKEPNTDSFPTNGLHLNAGTTAAGAASVCLDIQSNDMVDSNGGFGATDFRLRQRNSSTVNLPGYGGGSGDTAAVVSFVQGNNIGTPTGSATVSGSGGGFTGTGLACPTP